jgi:hypothetical protein
MIENRCEVARFCCARLRDFVARGCEIFLREVARFFCARLRDFVARGCEIFLREVARYWQGINSL